VAPLFATVDSDAAALIIPTPFRKTATIRPDPDPSGGPLCTTRLCSFG